MTQLSDYQAKIKDIDATLAQYEQLPIWKRLSMQAMGKMSNPSRIQSDL